MERHGERYDAIIVGGGPAGLSAALVLGRACRRVLVCDSDRPRNAAARGVHGFLTRDGTPPDELRRLGRAELGRYDNVEFRSVEVTDARCTGTGFVVRMDDGCEAEGRRLLIATGVVDELPPIPGFRELWGHGVHPCPYCDGWEVRGQRLGVYGRGQEALALCRALIGWSPRVTLLSNGPAELSLRELDGLAANGIAIISDELLELRSSTGGQGLAAAVVRGRAPIPLDALFVATGQHQRSPLLERLGCSLDAGGKVTTGEHGSTNVPGLYVAGDASRNVQLAIVAAAEGAVAAYAINRSLVREAFEHEARTR